MDIIQVDVNYKCDASDIYIDKKKNGYPCHLKLLIVTYDYPRKWVIINRVTLFIGTLIRMIFPSMRYIVKFDARLLLNYPYDVIMFYILLF